VCACVCLVSCLGGCECKVMPESFGGSGNTDIDFVIPASCDADRELAATRDTMIERDRDNLELLYTLRSIAKHASWARKVFVLQNPACEKTFMSRKIPEPSKTVWVNRCKLYPPGSEHLCPTRNSDSAYSVLHRIPDLADLFIQTDDDNLLVKPTQVATFFNRYGQPMRPLCGSPGSTPYTHFSNTGLDKNKVPDGGPYWTYFHVWIPRQKKLATQLEEEFPDWFGFVRSHVSGRYSSTLNQFGTAESERANSMEEDFGPIWLTDMCIHGVGDDSHPELFREHFIGSDYTKLEAWVQDPSILILNINDDLPRGPVALEKARTYMHSQLKRVGFGSLLTTGPASHSMEKERLESRMRLMMLLEKYLPEPSTSGYCSLRWPPAIDAPTDSSHMPMHVSM